MPYVTVVGHCSVNDGRWFAVVLRYVENTLRGVVVATENSGGGSHNNIPPPSPPPTYPTPTPHPTTSYSQHSYTPPLPPHPQPHFATTPPQLPHSVVVVNVHSVIAV